MKLTAMLAEVRTQVMDAIHAGAFWTPGAWCRKQRRYLSASAGAVVWLRGDAVRWGEWGARRGYFVVQHMDGLPYLAARAGRTREP